MNKINYYLVLIVLLAPAMSGYEIIGNSVVYDSVYANMSVTPHTVYNQGSEPYTYEINSKSTAGDLCLAWAFPVALQSGKIQLWENYAHQYTYCDNEYISEEDCETRYTDYFDWNDKTGYMNHIFYADQHIYYNEVPLPFDAWETKILRLYFDTGTPKGKNELWVWNSLSGSCYNDYVTGNYTFLYDMDPWYDSADQNTTFSFPYLTTTSFQDTFTSYTYKLLTSMEDHTDWDAVLDAQDLATDSVRMEHEKSVGFRIDPAANADDNGYIRSYLGANGTNVDFSMYNDVGLWIYVNDTSQLQQSGTAIKFKIFSENGSVRDFHIEASDLSNGWNQARFILNDPNRDTGINLSDINQTRIKVYSNTQNVSIKVDHFFLYNGSNYLYDYYGYHYYPPGVQSLYRTFGDYTDDNGVCELQYTPNGFGFNTTSLVFASDSEDYKYCQLEEDMSNYDDYEMIFKLSTLQDLGSNSLRLVSALNGYVRIHGSSSISYHIYDGNEYNGLTDSTYSFTINKPIYFRLVRNESVCSWYISPNLTTEWILRYNESCPLGPAYIRLHSKDVVGSYDNLLIRELVDEYVASDDFHPSFIYDSSNETEIKSVNITWYANNTINYSQQYSACTDFENLSYTILSNVSVDYYANITVCDVFDNCAWNVTNTVTMLTRGFYPCTWFGGVESLNMSIKHEDYITTPLNATVDIGGSYIYDSNEYDFNYSFSGDSSYSVCLFPSYGNFLTDMYIKYTVDGGFTHRYYFVNHSFNDNLQYVTLYNYNDTAGISDLIITARNKHTYQYLPNIITTLQRWYVGQNTWRSVQMDESGDLGQIFFNIHEENTDYRFVFRDRDNYDRILDTTSSMKFICTAAVCQYPVLLDVSEAETAQDNFTFNVYHVNDSGMINITWNDPDGVPFDINTRVARVMFNQTLYICNQTTTSTIQGFHECNISGLTGKFHVRIKTSRSPWDYQSSYWIDVSPARLSAIIGKTDSAFWAFGILATVIMFGAIISPVAALITMIVGLIIITLLGMLSVVGTGFIIVVCVIAVILGVKIKT